MSNPKSQKRKILSNIHNYSCYSRKSNRNHSSFINIYDKKYEKRPYNPSKTNIYDNKLKENRPHASNNPYFNLKRRQAD